mgnify:CR=1 FL=1
MDQRNCCLIGCEVLAEWVIAPSIRPGTYTEACTTHVGQLLTDAKEHHIYHIGDAKGERHAATSS